MKYPLILLALSACAHAKAPAAHTNPLDPHAPAPAIKHDSPLVGYRPFDEPPPLRPQAGATVRAPGGEPTHLPESAVKDSATTHHHHH